jgi:hypothetical protein
MAFPPGYRTPADSAFHTRRRREKVSIQANYDDADLILRFWNIET